LVEAFENLQWHRVSSGGRDMENPIQIGVTPQPIPESLMVSFSEIISPVTER
jgi:hypothetical protein